MRRRLMISTAFALGLTACSPQTSIDAATTVPTASEAARIGETAHKAYTDAINSNDIEKFMAAVTDDIVLQAPNMPEISGRAAVRAFVEGYLTAYTTRWDKTSRDFTVSGDWAFDRYSYRSTDTNKATGAVTTDVGKGMLVYHRDADGVWRVARDGWSSDAAPPS